MNNIILIIKQALKYEVINGPKTSFLLYWNAYGGKQALFKSIYFWASLFFSVLIMGVDYCSSEILWNWWGDAISIIPSILGFSLGGYAILISFGDAKFLSIMREKDTNEKYSLYMQVNATFLHFIFVQFLSVLYAVLIKGLHLTGVLFFNFLGLVIFLYALFTIVSTAFAVLNLASWFDEMGSVNDEKHDNEADK